MNKLRDTELIITNSGRIYHLNLKKEEIADDIILVGDPNRVQQISNKFEKIDFKITHREFITHTGYYNNKKISVISSGIGTDNIDIVMNELDALANINFETRQINKIKRSLNIIRLGTSGGLNKKIDVDSFLVSEYAIGLDGLAHFYKNNDVLDEELSKIFFNKTNWSKNHASPYSVKASDKLLNKFNNFSKGITLTATGFYGPQCRNIRLKSSISDFNPSISTHASLLLLFVFSICKVCLSNLAPSWFKSEESISSINHLPSVKNSFNLGEFHTSQTFGLSKSDLPQLFFLIIH